MNIKIITLVALISFLLSACAGVGLSDSSDPYKKLDFSYLAMDQGRHIPSERYIKQAIKIFKEKNDKAGLAEAYFTYGLFYKYGPWQLFSGPINTDKSAEYFIKAISLFKGLNDSAGAAKSYLGLGNVQIITKDRELACDNYDKAIAQFDKGTGQKFPIRPGFKDFRDMVNAFKDKYCN